MLRGLRATYRAHGLAGVSLAACQMLMPTHAACLAQCLDMVAGRSGLEVGGPSGVFRERGVLPLYSRVAALDNCNFATHTTWEGSISEGQPYHFADGRAPGRQYVAETTDLSAIPSGRYDFLLSSHVIEHTANPLCALSEWMRVLKDGGALVVLVPHKDGTFDHRRAVTSLDHLVQDHADSQREDDLTHLPEILALHDLRRDPEAGTAAQFQARSERNMENRCLHHHVFDSALVARMLDHVGLQLVAVEAVRPHHVIALGRKAHPGEVPVNGAFLTRDAEFLRRSPFPTDRRA